MLMTDQRFGIFRTTIDGKFTRANTALAEMCGFSSLEEFMQCNLSELSTNTQQMKKLISELCEKEVAKNYEILMKKKDGTPLWTSWSCKLLCNEENEPLLLEGIIENINECKRTEESLQVCKEKYRALFEIVPLAIMIIDAETLQFENANRMALDLYGYSNEEFLRLRTEDIFSDQDKMMTSFHTVKDENSDNPFSSLHLFKTKESTFFSAEMNSGMFTAYGRTKIMVSVRTMTEQKKLEEQLYRAQKMASLGTLVGSIAHEFRNVLNVIIGFGSLIKEDLREDDPLMSDLKPILSTAQGATNLTESLLSFCRKKVNGQRLLNINDTIRCSRIILLKIIGENIQLETMLDDRDLTVRMDSGQIEQVLINLAMNARDAMPNGGQLSIQTKLVNLNRKITQRHCHETQQLYALISVVDSGTGMDEVTRENLFEPFYTTKEPGKGTGLGLAVLNGIIKQHDGYIHVSSQEGQGTAFKIYLPIMNAKTDEMKLGYHRRVGLRGDTENPRLTDN